ncbi:MAG: glycoside hydrolase family 3 C-terminal domain-containing protein, partial [Umezawaea sp.]
HPDVAIGVEIPTVLEALRDEFPDAEVEYAQGCTVDGPDLGGLAEAIRVARDADVCVAVLGDRAGLFGRGTSGEGCDAEDLTLPGVQSDLLAALLDADVPVVLVLVAGRPYALGDHRGAAATVQTFFPGEEGAGAIAGVLSGRVNPSGKLPVQVPNGPGGQPTTYLRAKLGGPGEVSSADPTPRFPFGHGLSYTAFGYRDLELSDDTVPTDGEVEISCVVTNTGTLPGVEVVQLYLHDPVASVARPERQLAGFARVELAAGESTRVAFRLHADRTSFTGIDGRRVVEPGVVEVLVGSSSEDVRLTGDFCVVGPPREVGYDRVLTTPVVLG